MKVKIFKILFARSSNKDYQIAKESIMKIERMLTIPQRNYEAIYINDFHI